VAFSSGYDGNAASVSHFWPEQDEVVVATWRRMRKVTRGHYVA
jgi:hypothetical protein